MAAEEEELVEEGGRETREGLAVERQVGCSEIRCGRSPHAAGSRTFACI